MLAQLTTGMMPVILLNGVNGGPGTLTESLYTLPLIMTRSEQSPVGGVQEGNKGIIDLSGLQGKDNTACASRRGERQRNHVSGKTPRFAYLGVDQTWARVVAINNRLSTGYARASAPLSIERRCDGSARIDVGRVPGSVVET
ncbi:hypothetical protein BV25DRAFT_1818850 [Artomyces pyxidatus]|uniref:Uncharacterized protein n=1 Tax=Artomyces pyxidatus TaxID=48021 RepID=A0ACB8TJ99_9AGAM|nr:hypothetical protein BV25DRAFT_1818850 [Artomyces pyxidatus]